MFFLLFKIRTKKWACTYLVVSSYFDLEYIMKSAIFSIASVLYAGYVNTCQLFFLMAIKDKNYTNKFEISNV